MQRSALLNAALLSSAAALSSACNDLGSCDDPALGRTTVQIGGQLMFTGQAIINKSCASCHGSNSKASVRQGAPAGLDFDVFPLASGTVVNGTTGAPAGLQFPAADLAALRSHQRKIYDNRELIWEQVEKGLMPPKSTAFASLAGIFASVFGADMKCTKGVELTTLGASKEEFRNWLACDTPIIEATSDKLGYKALGADATVADKAAGAAYYSLPQVSVGYQYPACDSSGGGDGGVVSAPSFSQIYTDILKPNCAVCHLPGGLNSTVDFSSEAVSFTSLLGANGMGKPQSCATNTNPYVTPGDPTKSYLINKMDSTTPSAQRCGDIMPQGTGSTPADVAKVKAWIMGGALRMPAASSAGGADAGAGADGGT